MHSAADTRIQNTPQPERTDAHEALAVFLGDWTAEGLSYGGSDQSGENKRANGVPWVSEHKGYWHTGGFFLIQDEQARPDGQTFDTISIMGVDPKSGDYFARSFENHGYYRNYRVSRDGDVWTISGETERATITLSDANRKQTIAWEWKPKDDWLPLCDRVAVRKDV